LDENTNDQRTNDQDDGINGGTRRTIGCGRPQPIKLIKPSADKLFIEFDASDQDIPGNGERRQQLLAKDAHTILKLISNDDIIKLGFHPKYARPEWFIWTVLPVPPPPTRPSVEFGSGISDDDLTHKYINIVKANNALRRSKENGDAPNIQQEVRQKFVTGKSWKAV
jgi:DNA-directed RNA polymerase II subunit RPB1